MGHIDGVEKVAGRLTGVVVAQVDRQADRDGLAALQRGHIVVDGKHEAGTEVARHRYTQRMGAVQHLPGAEMPLKELQLVVGQKAVRAVDLGLFFGLAASGAAVKIAEAVLRKVPGRGTVGRGYAVQLAGVAQRQIVAHDGF